MDKIQQQCLSCRRFKSLAGYEDARPVCTHREGPFPLSSAAGCCMGWLAPRNVNGRVPPNTRTVAALTEEENARIDAIAGWSFERVCARLASEMADLRAAEAKARAEKKRPAVDTESEAA